jgi:hypothetical protein
MRYRVWFLAVAVVLLVCIFSYADVPKLINFQGRLTDVTGKFVSDGNYPLTFKLYSDSTGGSAKWTEAQIVTVSKGLFNVILGSQTPIPDSIFDYSNVWLGIQVGADPEMAPRQRLSSLGYSYRGAKADSSNYSKDSDKLDGLHASDFSSPASDYGRSGVAKELYEGDSTLSSLYVNEGQANSITSEMITDNEIVNADISTSANISPSKISGIAWTSANDGSGSGLDADLLDGQQASAFLSTGNDYGRSGVATDLYEGTTTLTNKYVNEVGPDSVYSTSGTAFKSKVAGSNAVALYGFEGRASNKAAGSTYGSYGYASNSVNGASYAGYFTTSDSGTGQHFGVVGQGYGASAAATYGVLGSASNSSTGDVYAGSFTTSQMGTGTHYGVQAQGLAASTSPTYGINALGSNSSSGTVYGGFFSTLSSGTGTHYGLRAESYSSGTATTYGTYSYAENTSSGISQGGYFYTSSAGTGTHYGARGVGNGASDANVYGLYGFGSNTSTGEAYGGYFFTSSSGTGKHYGVYSGGYGSSDSTTYGYYGYGYNSSTGDVYAGFFTTSTSGTGVHIGVKSESYGNSSSSVNGINSKADNTSTGPAYGGIFNATSSGTGSHYGIYSSSTGSSDNSTYGIYSAATNTSTGDAFGGHFAANSNGTGSHFGVYGQAASNTSNGWVYGGYFTASGTATWKIGVWGEAPTTYYAGMFSGNVWVSSDFGVGGDKNAVVKVDNGEYHMLSSQESPEVWFEDFGEGQLINGRTHIELDPLFLQTVTINSQHPMKVFIQLNDENCNGTAVKRGTTGFDVIELQNGTSNASFSYRIVAKRKGYEDKRLAKFKGPTPEEMAIQSEKIKADMEKERVRMEQENQAIGSEK